MSVSTWHWLHRVSPEWPGYSCILKIEFKNITFFLHFWPLWTVQFAAHCLSELEAYVMGGRGEAQVLSYTSCACFIVQSRAVPRHAVSFPLRGRNNKDRCLENLRIKGKKFIAPPQKNIHSPVVLISHCVCLPSEWTNLNINKNEFQVQQLN